MWVTLIQGKQNFTVSLATRFFVFWWCGLGWSCLSLCSGSNHCCACACCISQLNSCTWTCKQQKQNSTVTLASDVFVLWWCGLGLSFFVLEQEVWNVCSYHSLTSFIRNQYVLLRLESSKLHLIPWSWIFCLLMVWMGMERCCFRARRSKCLFVSHLEHFVFGVQYVLLQFESSKLHLIPWSRFIKFIQIMPFMQISRVIFEANLILLRSLMSLCTVV